MKLCLGGVSTAEAAMAKLATKILSGWDCRRRDRVGRAGALKSNRERERQGRRRVPEEEERTCAVGSRSCDSSRRLRNRWI